MIYWVDLHYLTRRKNVHLGVTEEGGHHRAIIHAPARPCWIDLRDLLTNSRITAGTSLLDVMDDVQLKALAKRPQKLHINPSWARKLLLQDVANNRYWTASMELYLDPMGMPPFVQSLDGPTS